MERISHRMGTSLGHGVLQGLVSVSGSPAMDSPESR